jgi:hypothetical protein
MSLGTTSSLATRIGEYILSIIYNSSNLVKTTKEVSNEPFPDIDVITNTSPEILARFACDLQKSDTNPIDHLIKLLNIVNYLDIPELYNKYIEEIYKNIKINETSLDYVESKLSAPIFHDVIVCHNSLSLGLKYKLSLKLLSKIQTNLSIYDAVCIKNLELLKYLHVHRNYKLEDSLIFTAIQYEDIEIVKYICEFIDISKVNKDIYDKNKIYIANCRNTDILTFIINKGLIYIQDIFDIACNHGNYEFVKLVYNQPNIEIGHQHMASAASIGSIKILNLLYSLGHELYGNETLISRNYCSRILRWWQEKNNNLGIENLENI